jgi:putative FmdB family regulatory protein
MIFWNILKENTMPIREYQCIQCHTEFEELVSGDDVPACAACGSRNVTPLISRCCHHGSGGDASMSAPGGGCSGCAGGSCASCH